MTNSKDIFFTIIIPTRERVDTLVHTIATALAQDYANFEVLVSDNASKDDTREQVLSIHDSRIRYINTGARVSMSENWEFAINHVEEGWITILGDDDGILPGSLNHVNQIIQKTTTHAVRSNGCSFAWPSLNGVKYGNLGVSLKRGYVVRKSKKVLQSVIDGRTPYNELPMLYNGGFVSIDLIRKAKEVTGRLFCSMTPDVYTAIVFGFLTERYVYSHEPLAINGASSHSGGTAEFERKKRIRPYDPAKKFASEPNLPFHQDLPLTKEGLPVRCISVLVYEAFLQAKPFHDRKDIATSHAKQLGIALEKSGPDPKEIKEWAESFSIAHSIERPSSTIWQIRRLIDLPKRSYFRLVDGARLFALEGSWRVPLKNVYEATIVAGAIKTIRPPLLQRFVSKLSRLRK